MHRRYILALILAAVLFFGCQLLTTSRNEPAETRLPALVTQPAVNTQPAVVPNAATPTVMSDLPVPGEGLKQTPPSGKDPFPIHTVQPPNGEVPANPAFQGIDNLLALTSIKIQLNLDWSDGSMRRYSAEIDARGSLHLIEQSENSSGIDPEMSATRETYRINGKLYRQDGENGDWTATAEEADPLARLLNGSTGPGLWLSLLPGAALHPDGEESTGGFNAEKYSVAGMIEDAELLGTIWLDKDTRALVKAELAIPGKLLVDPSAKDPGEMTIKMEVEKAEVGEIKLP